MTFSASVKEELTELEVENECCIKAMTYGMLLFARAFSSHEMYLKTENDSVAQKYSDLINYMTGIDTRDKKTEAGINRISVPFRRERLEVMEEFGHSEKDITLRINRANLPEECCVGAFLRGVFLSCGSIAKPEREYHLEFSIQYRGLARDLAALLNELDLNPKETIRKGYSIIYFKESEAIEDILTYMGATNSSLKLMNIKIYKDFRNKVNRVINCETANITKTVNAAAAQIAAIKKLEENDLLKDLSEDVQELARIRMDNPELSLREMGELMSNPLTRSGVNHRLKKIMDAASECDG